MMTHLTLDPKNAVTALCLCTAHQNSSSDPKAKSSNYNICIHNLFKSFYFLVLFLFNHNYFDILYCQLCILLISTNIHLVDATGTYPQ